MRTAAGQRVEYRRRTYDPRPSLPRGDVGAEEVHLRAAAVLVRQHAHGEAASAELEGNAVGDGEGCVGVLDDALVQGGRARRHGSCATRAADVAPRTCVVKGGTSGGGGWHVSFNASHLVVGGKLARRLAKTGGVSQVFPRMELLKGEADLAGGWRWRGGPRVRRERERPSRCRRVLYCHRRESL
jgi:hypothetical protein